MNYDDKSLNSQTNLCPPGTGQYTVKAGDTLYNIARLYGTTVTAIIIANPGINPNRLQIGARICIPSAGPSPCPGGVNYTIRPGDTLYQLATRFNVTVTTIIMANPGVNSNRLAIGETICIPGIPSVPSPQLKLPCCSILAPTATDLPPLPDLPALPEGSVVLRQVAVLADIYALLFAANGLPDPNTLGNYDAYLGSIYLSGRSESRLHSAFLGSTAPFEQPVTWSGTLLLAETPQPGDILEISPVNTAVGVKVEAALLGSLGNCDHG